MPRALINIPVAKGLDGKIDERIKSPDSLSVAQNAYFRRNNALTKRNGFERLPTSVVSGLWPITSGGQPKGLMSTGDELLIRGARELFSYQDGATGFAAGWISRGELSPFTGKQTTVFSDARSIATCDTAEVPNINPVGGEGYVGLATTTYNLDEANNYISSLNFTLRTGEREILQNKVVLLSNTTGPLAESDLCACRIIGNYNDASGGGNDAHFHIGVHRPPAGGATAQYGRLVMFRWTRSAPLSAPTLTTTYSDLYYPAFNYSVKRFDLCSYIGGTYDGNYGLAYVKNKTVPPGATVTNIYVSRMNNLNNLASIELPPPVGYQFWQYCAIAQGGVNQNRCYVVGVADNGAGPPGNQAIYLYALNAATMTVAWGPVQVRTITSSAGFFANIGVAEGTDSGATNRVVVTWTEQRTDTSGIPIFGSYNDAYRVCAQSFTTAGVANGSFSPINAHAELVSKPWWEAGRLYAGIRYKLPTVISSWNPTPYCAEAIIDFDYGVTEADLFGLFRHPRMIGRFDFGTTAGEVDSYMQRFGSLSQVYKTSTAYDSRGNASALYRYTTTRVASQQGESAAGDDTILVTAEEIETDYNGIVTQGSSTRGTATLGGGSCSYYASAKTEELGWCSGPFITRGESLNHADGTLPAGTYQYVACYESWDEKGNLTRSLPGPPTSLTIAGGGANDAMKLEICTLGASQRYDKKRFGLGVYRAGSDGIFRRCNEAAHFLQDTEFLNFWTPNFVDRGFSFDVLYTQGGAELEAVGPDGAAFVTVTSKRVWLAGFYRRDRVQYSKPYDPSTPNEYALAPEFNDAFSFLLPGGEPVTGLIEMDDKVIVFTKSNIYAIAGNGPDDGGRGNDFSGLQLVASDTGCVDARSVVSSPIGVFFQAPSGIFLLGRDLQLQFIGAAVRDVTEAYTECTSAVLVPQANHVRFTLKNQGDALNDIDPWGTILIYDLDQLAWLQWMVQIDEEDQGNRINPVGACLHNGRYHVLASNGAVYRESTTSYFDPDNFYIPMVIETGWLQAAEQSGWQRVRKVAALLKRLDGHSLTMKLYVDFASTPSQQYTWGNADLTAQKLSELIEMHVREQKGTAFKIRIEDAAVTETVTGQGYECAGFTVELSGKRGLYKPGTQQRN